MDQPWIDQRTIYWDETGHCRCVSLNLVDNSDSSSHPVRCLCACCYYREKFLLDRKCVGRQARMRTGRCMRFLLKNQRPSTFQFLPTVSLLFATVLSASAATLPIEIPMKPYIEGLRVLELTIDGKRGQFIFDSAGGMTVMTPEFLQSTGLKSFGRLTGFRHDGEKLQTQRVAIHSLTAGGVALPLTELATFDLTALLKGAPVVQGLVALNCFDGAVVTIDCAQGRLLLENPDSLRTRIKDMAPLRIRASRESGGAALDLFAAVESPNGTLWLLMDSANVGPVLLSPHAIDQLEIIPVERRAKATLQMSELVSYPCNIAVKETIYDGLLNTDFFLQHVVTLDLRTMRAWVRKNHPPSTTRAP